MRPAGWQARRSAMHPPSAATSPRTRAAGTTARVCPSDTAPALVVLEARMVIKTAKAERVVDAEKFFIGPATDITHMTVVKPEELLVAIRIPNKWSGAKFYFEKVADRNTWDFALVNVAS